MTGMQVSPTTSASILMMVGMMLPGAIPAIARRARESDGVLAAPVFASSYLGIWGLVGLAMCALYRPPGALIAGGLTIAAGLYELTPLKRDCRRRCRERIRSGLQFGLLCVGSSIGLMLVLVAVNVMSLEVMGVIALVVLVQKVFPPHPAVDVPLALAIVVCGLLIAAT